MAPAKQVKAFRFDDVDNSLDFSSVAPVPQTEEPEIKVAKVKIKEKDKEPEKEKVEETKPEGIPKELENKYMMIYDAIMFEDKYELPVSLGKKYSAVFTTRSADADVMVARQLDAMNFQTISAYQTMSAVLTMSHSLVELNGIDLRSMDVGKRYELIKNKSSHLIEVLSRHMVEFDSLVRDALAYGEENF